MGDHSDIDHTGVTGVPAAGIAASLLDAKGDLIVASAADTAAKLTVGTNTHVLTANSGATNGIEWAAPSAGTTYENVFVGNFPPMLAISSPTALTANRAYLYKFVPMKAVTVTTAYWNCTTSNGNLDFGIYNADFSSRLASTGSFSSPGTGNRSQVFASSGSVAMVAGTVYYLAFAASSTTLRVAQLTAATAMASGGWNVAGREESALPLPSSIASVDAWEDGTVHPLFFFK